MTLVVARDSSMRMAQVVFSLAWRGGCRGQCRSPAWCSMGTSVPLFILQGCVCTVCGAPCCAARTPAAIAVLARVARVVAACGAALYLQRVDTRELDAD